MVSLAYHGEVLTYILIQTGKSICREVANVYVSMTASSCLMHYLATGGNDF